VINLYRSRKKKIRRDKSDQAHREAKVIREAEQQAAAKTAKDRWDSASEVDPIHPYLAKKRLLGAGLRQDGDLLLVPVCNYDGQIQAVQTISSNGDKLFWPKGCRTKGCHMMLSQPKSMDKSTLLVVEGYATGAAVSMSTGMDVLVTFFAGNLLPATKHYTNDYETIIFMADDDQKEGTDRNTGIGAAEAAARAIGGQVAYPNMGKKADFWDLWNLSGKEAVMAALEISVEKISDRVFEKSVTSVTAFTGKGFSRFGIVMPSSLSSLENIVPWEEKPSQSHSAEEIADLLGNILLFDSISAEWFLRRENCWGQVPTLFVENLIKGVISKKIEEGFSAAYFNSIKSLVKLNLAFSNWNTDQNFIPVKNGVLDVRTKTLSPYKQDDRFSWQLDYDFVPGAACPSFIDFLNTVTRGIEETQNAIRAMMLAIVTRRADLQRFFEIVGPGGSGKSTLINICTKLIGHENQATTDLKNLEQNRFETSSLYGKRLILINDSGKYGGEVAALKAITGGDHIRFEQKNKDVGKTFKVSGVVIIVANQPIASSDYTTGLSRRRVTIPFNHRVSEQEKAKFKKDGGIETLLEKELPGILNWCLAMGAEEMVDILTGKTGLVDRTKRQIAVQTNPVLAWLDETMVADPDSVLHVGVAPTDDGDPAIVEKLFSSFTAYCTRRRLTGVALQRFGQTLSDQATEFGITLERLPKSSGGARFRGLRFRDAALDRNTPTLITNEFLAESDEEMKKECRRNRPQTHGNDDSDSGDVLLQTSNSYGGKDHKVQQKSVQRSLFGDIEPQPTIRGAI
jgi:P4 family phage/plasmid primase-like protien